MVVITVDLAKGPLPVFSTRRLLSYSDTDCRTLES